MISPWDFNFLTNPVFTNVREKAPGGSWEIFPDFEIRVTKGLR
jgi:hypothetical protein